MPQRGHRIYSLICCHCCAMYTAARSDSLYCSDRCKQAAKRARANATKTGTEGLTPMEVEALNTLGIHNDDAALAIMHLRRDAGLKVARIALYAAWKTLHPYDTEFARPYAMGEAELRLRGELPL